MLVAELAMICERGGRAVNEDAGGHWKSDSVCCAVLADGAGGHGGGDVASKLIVDSVLREFSAAPAVDIGALERVVQDADRVLLAKQSSARDLAQMRTTVAMLVVGLHEGRAVWGHLGDTRLYHFRAGALLSRTRDHSAVEQMVEAGYLEERQARAHPSRNVLHASLGDHRAEQTALATGAARVVPGDVFLLCSDGLWELVEDMEMSTFLRNSSTPQEWLGLLKNHVMRMAKAGSDNYSAIGVWIK